ncbi:helix-turn-helix transcriptional regulator [Nocardia sp. NPDC004604]|uniref:helix-turn-helix domain-containing protein n=1 Tax=Nocardia sp. NPDC004604 TaxID=3157013 RepID=UPI0033A35F9F
MHALRELDSVRPADAMVWCRREGRWQHRPSDDHAVSGLTDPQFAARLFISRGTVETHLAHVYAELGIADRTELARLAPGAGSG